MIYYILYPLRIYDYIMYTRGEFFRYLFIRVKCSKKKLICLYALSNKQFEFFFYSKPGLLFYFFMCARDSACTVVPHIHTPIFTNTERGNTLLSFLFIVYLVSLTLSLFLYMNIYKKLTQSMLLKDLFKRVF